MMRGQRRILIGDIIWWVFLSVLVSSLCIAAAFTPQEWEITGIVLLAVVPSGFWVITVVIVIKQLFAVPTFIVILNGSSYASQIGVWSAATPDVTEEMIRNALELFVQSFMGPAIVRQQLDQLTIEFRADPIKEWGRSSWSSPKAGLQKGRAILVHWNGSISGSAFFHELLHWADEYIRQPRALERHQGWEPDYAHEDKEWWDREALLNADYREQYE